MYNIRKDTLLKNSICLIKKGSTDYFRCVYIGTVRYTSQYPKNMIV